MPLRKDPLLEALSDVRDTLKTRYKDDAGRTPVICSDEALKEMAKRKPLKKTDFKAIQGLGDVFVNRYAEDFLREIYKHKHRLIQEVSVSKKSKKILADYQDRLTNISKRNRNLYTGKLSQKLGLDLSDAPEAINFDTFMRNIHTKPVKLTDTKYGSQDAFYRRLTLLYRHVNRDAKETGSYHLFIAYPFIEGKLPGDGFIVKAPLMFFPVVLTRKGHDFYLRFDRDKDIRFNRDLLLANQKFNQLEDLKTDPDPEHLDINAINKQLLPFLETNHLPIKAPYKSTPFFEPFLDTVKDDFKKVKKGDLSIKNYGVLGHYKPYSSKLQEDISAIIDHKAYNNLLEGLLENALEPYDYSVENPFNESTTTPVKESALTYINDLNYAQEKVLNLVDQNDKLVIWGPPGTGKSQTITALIAKQIEKGENVLVVSEKKVALDVIKNRLGYASKFALFMDDAQDKQAFYTQLKNHIDPLPPKREHNNDIESINVAITKVMKKLENMHKGFYTQANIGQSLYKLYPRYIQTKKLKEAFFPETITESFFKVFKDLDYNTIQTLEHMASNTKKLKNMLIYKQHVDGYPIIKAINTKLTRSEKLKRTAFYKAVDAFLDTYNQAIFFRKGRLRRQFIKEHAAEITYLFDKTKHRKRFIKLLIQDPDFYDQLKTHFFRYERARHQMRKLTPEKAQYLEMLLYHEPYASIPDIHLKQTDIFDALYTGIIEDFEAKNQDKVYDLMHYKEHMEHLQTLIREKTHMVSETFAMNLYEDALSFSNSKRIMDIKHRLEQSRKLSVSSFISHYQLELFSNIKVWMMTPEVISEIIPLNYAMFDLVIFDEASQMFVEKAIPTIYRAKKVVIAGDTKQLRPSSLGQGKVPVDETEEDELLDITLDAKSLLDLARHKYKETILNYHYRSKYEELISFSNYAFYDGKLLVSPNKTQPKKPPIEYLICEDGLWENRQNVAEAKKVIELIKKVIRQKDKDETIGVITFNTQQRNLVEDLLDEEMFSNARYRRRLEHELNRIEDGEDKSLFIKNIENVQGDERDIIIFTTAYAKNKEGRFLRQFGWLNNEGGQNRLNVAISRAKKKIFIVSSFHPASLHVEDLKSLGPKRLKAYLMYCYHISNKDVSAAQKVLETISDAELIPIEAGGDPLRQDVLNRLEKEDFMVQTDVGIGKYKLDFGLKNTDQTYKLGIICDSDPNTNVRDGFYHQEKYLQARGWQVYRIFAPAWYKDPNKHMREIRKHMKEA